MHPTLYLHRLVVASLPYSRGGKLNRNREVRMKLKRLSITNLRAFDHAEFDFHPEFTLLAGVNGAGKTTVLESLRICMSRLLRKFTISQAKPRSFWNDDIQVGATALSVDLDLSINFKSYKLKINSKHEQCSITSQTGHVRDQTPFTTDSEMLIPKCGTEAMAVKEARLNPVDTIGVYFGINRSMATYGLQGNTKANGGPKSAYAYALADQGLRLADLASWMHALEQKSSELPKANHHLHALRTAVNRFLPECKNMQAVVVNYRPRLYFEKQGHRLDSRKLSDGEKSMLALVSDLAMRLCQANPSLDDPVRDGAGIVLVDDIELHLHPQWQRKIVEQLCETFPNCQFVATTHSPQIIGEVEHRKIRMIVDGKVHTPPRSFGIDSSRILEELMESKSRNAAIDEQISKISKLIGRGKSDAAKKEIRDLSDKIGEDDPEITRALTYLEFMEDSA